MLSLIGVRFENGHLRVGEIHGIPIRLHWTLPVGMLLLGGFSPVAWLAFAILVLVHEAGHALLVRRYGLQVLSIDLTGFGGVTRWAGHTSERQRSVIAWGGVAAQAVLLGAAALVLVFTGWPSSQFGHVMASVLTRTNALLIGINLLPFAPFDGAQAWLLPRQWLRRMRDRRRYRLGH
jgi:Zn-dependent protease